MKKSFWIIVLGFIDLLISSPLERLSNYKYDIYSQFGEDGIIEKIFDIIGSQSKIAIEFGATDGFYCSNTANLWTHGWKGYLIEGNYESFLKLSANVAGYDCIAIHRMVGIDKDNNLDKIAKDYNIPADVDLLSIDIDGNDYHVFQAIQELRPRVIICEYNPSIPVHLDVYSSYGNNIGASVAALIRIAEAKDYCLIAITDTNCIFVTKEEFEKFAEFDTDPSHIFIKRYLTYIIYDYYGHPKVIGASPDYMEPWGFQPQKSGEILYGNIIEVSATYQKAF